MGWLEDMVKNDQIQEGRGDKNIDYLSLFLVGKMGAGKTRFIGSCPAPLILNFDKGLTTLDAMGIPYKQLDFKLRVKTYDAVIQFLKDARDRKGPFAGPVKVGDVTVDYSDRKTLALDGITGLSEQLLNEVMILEGQSDPTRSKATFDHYGFVKARMMTIFDLWKDIKMHKVVTALPKLEFDEETQTHVGSPLMVGAYRSLVGKDFDEVYFLNARPGRRDGDPITYECHTRPFQYWDAKSRLDLPNPIESPTFSKIWNHISGKEPLVALEKKRPIG